MKRMVIVLLAVVAMVLVLVVAPVAARSSTTEEYPSTSTEGSEAVGMTETTPVKTVVEPTVAETYASYESSEESDEVGDELVDVPMCDDADMGSFSGESVPDESYDYEYTDAIYEEPANDAVSYYDDTNSYSYSDYDLDLLARLIYVENGCEWMPDWVQLYTGSVVLNRVNSPLYADTIEGVIYEPGQYVPSALYYDTPDARTYENARILLEGGSILPADVMGQNGFNAGDGTYATYYDEVLGSTEYFTYVYG